MSTPQQETEPGKGSPRIPDKKDKNSKPASAATKTEENSAENPAETPPRVAASESPAEPVSGPAHRNESPGVPRETTVVAPVRRRARLRLSRIDPWSAMRISFVLSLALGIVTLVATTVLWLILNITGFFDSVGQVVGNVTGAEGNAGSSAGGFLSLPYLLGGAAVVAAIDVFVLTALGTLAAFLYNMSAGFVGGLELTLAEDDE